MTETPEKRVTPDWERIEADFRAGILSLREIGTKDGHVTEGAIRKRAKKLGWARDLSARIQAKAEELVRKEAVRNEGTQLATANPAAERVIVEANAEAIAGVRLRQRKDISRASRLVMSLLVELEALTAQPLMIERLEELLDQVSAGDAEDVAKVIAKARDALTKATSLPSRAGTMKSLADSLKTLVTLEREAWGLKANDEPDDPAASQFEDIRDSNLRTIEQLSARLASPALSSATAPGENPVSAEPVAGTEPKLSMGLAQLVGAT